MEVATLRLSKRLRSWFRAHRRKALHAPDKQVEQAPRSPVVEPSPPVLDLPPGYTYLSALRQGGLGTVMVVREEHTGRKVALKRLRKDRRGDEHCRGLIEAEARITARLQHPNIVPVYDLGEDEDGNFFYTMRLVPGQTLGEYLDSVTEQRTTQPSDRDRRRLVDCLRKVCDAVMYAHDRGVLHLDLKPSNILVGDFGGVLLLDWGCAALRQVETEVGESTGRPAQIPRPLAPRGTPEHMAPEQFDGDEWEVGETADVYQLGGILFEILTLGPPKAWWRRTVVEPLALRSRPRFEMSPSAANAPGTVGGPLAAICERALSYDPKRRYPSVTEFAQDIDRWFHMERVTAYKERFFGRCARILRGHPRLASAVVASSALICLFNVQLLRVTTQGYGQTLSSLVSGHGTASIGGVSALHGLFETREGVMDPDEFESLASFYHTSFPGIQALSWAPRVEHEDRASFEESVRRSADDGESTWASFSVIERVSGGGFVAAAVREEYFPVRYIVPLAGNAPAVGFDLGSVANRRALLQAASDRDGLSVSEPLRLVQTDGSRAGILAAAPVRGSGAGGAVEGFVTGVLLIDDLLAHSWREIDIRYLTVRVFDVSNPAAPMLLWSSDGRTNFSAERPEAIGTGVLSARSDFALFDRRWSVWVRPTPEFLIKYPLTLIGR